MKKTKNEKSTMLKRGVIALGSLIGVIAISICIILNLSPNNTGSSDSNNLTIPKKNITEVAKFYPVKITNTNMEVLAVKAKDGTIRTALNTCQVCYDSGRGYYKQDGDVLVCQNCGNRFKMDQVEQVKGGCNPVPILKENKTEDDEKIVISKQFLENNVNLFQKWSKE